MGIPADQLDSGAGTVVHHTAEFPRVTEHTDGAAPVMWGRSAPAASDRWQCMSCPAWGPLSIPDGRVVAHDHMLVAEHTIVLIHESREYHFPLLTEARG